MEIDMDLDEREQEEFGPVLANLRRDCLPKFASEVRHAKDSSLDMMECNVLPELQCGSYHVVLTLVFVDGISWVLKIPSKGKSGYWNDIMARGLESEANTMRLIRRETGIPVPEVHAFDSSLDSGLGCPFILMEKVPGRHLDCGWFDEEVSQAKRDNFRVRALQGIATAMVQLNGLSFDKGGCLVFDADGGVFGVGPRHFIDWDTVYDRVIREDFDDHLPFRENGPFEDEESYFFVALDGQEMRDLRTPFKQGAHILLRLLTKWGIEDHGRTPEGSFVLTHPDFDTQNIFTAEDGTLTGIIDWDWVATVPQSLGCLKLPKFLTRDYDPRNYHYDIKAGKPKGRHNACSPAELSYYRALYAQSIESCTKSHEAANVTRRSLVLSMLEDAADSPFDVLDYLEHLFLEVEKLTATKADDHSYSDTESEASDGSDGEDEQKDPHERMSLDQLLEEIERLSAASSEAQTTHENELACLSHESSPPSETGESELQADTKLSHGRRLAGIACSWGSKKCQEAAEKLYQRQSEVVKPSENTGAHHIKSGAGDPSKIEVVWKWIRKMLRLAVEAIHCKSSENFLSHERNLKAPVTKSWKSLAKWVLTTIKQPIELLHRGKEVVSNYALPPIIQNPAGCEEVLSDKEKIAACRYVAGALKENSGGLLSEGGRQAIAQWIITTLLPKSPSGDEPQSEGDFDCESGDMFRDPIAEEEALEEKLQSRALKRYSGIAERAASEGSRKSEYEWPDCNYFRMIFPNHNRFDDAAAQDESYSPLCEHKDSIGQCSSEGALANEMHTRKIKVSRDQSQRVNGAQANSSDDIKSEKSEGLKSDTNDGGADSDTSTEITSVSDLDCEIDPTANDPDDISIKDLEEPHDYGTFTMWDVCIALSKGSLDEPRMKRLKEGFFALLNQTL